MKSILFFFITLFASSVPVAGEPSVKYHGNRESLIFHRSSCRHFNCGNCTADFQNRDAAIAAGYRPCKVCNP